MPNLEDQILKELQILRKLKMMELSKAGHSQSQMAEALGISQQTVSNLMAKPKKNKSEGKPAA
jgi:DNA-binding CsgD family transcriptional regulator